MKKQTALVTGATSGIGLNLAILFAENGYDLVIVARDKKRLTQTANQLKALGSKNVLEISVDLSRPGSAQKIYDRLKDEKMVVNVLVNDAGAGEYGPFSETSLEEELAIIQLNVVSVVHLTKLFLQDMLKRNEGKILQLASIASYQPTPLLAVYAATKAFVLSFTDAIINEIRETNVTMTALIPGATDTAFFERSHSGNTKAAQHPADPADVAKIGFEALMKGEPHAVGPGMTPQIILSSLLPNQKVADRARKSMLEIDGDDPTHHANGKKNSARQKQHDDKKSGKVVDSSEVTGLRQLFIAELKDIYWAEKALIKALPKMAKKASTTELSNAIEQHLAETAEQAMRLEKVFEVLGEKARVKTCEAMKGLIAEAEEMMKETDSGFICDAAIISAAQKVEHYEIATYGTLVAFADTLGETRAAEILEKTLAEEKSADRKLSSLAESFINLEAAEADE